MIALYLVLGILTVIALFFIVFLLLIRPRPIRNRPDTSLFSGKQFAHRGLHTDTVPENSLRAFEKAAERGLGSELDIQLSADGQVVVFHDFNLKRATGLDKKVCELTAEELSKLSLFGQGDGIPTLKQVLELIDGRVPLIIEMKIPESDLALCPKAFELLDEYQGAYCIESFHPLAIRWMRKNRPNILRGQLSCDFFKGKKKKCSLHLFIVKNLLSNALSKPDFIAFNEKDSHAIAFRLCCKLWHALPIAWTIRSNEQLERAKGNFDAWICEKIYEQ